MKINISMKIPMTAVAGVAFLAGSPAFAATAAENYGFYCAQCHGVSAKGDGPNATRNMPVSPRNLTSRYEMEKLTDDEIISVIREGGAVTGKSTLMPPFGRTLAAGEITAMKDYLRKLCKCKGG